VFGLFHFYRQIFLGEAASGISAQVADLTIRERMYLFPVVAAVLFCGIYPRPFLETVRPAAVALLSMVK
jgi:NADH-quinone oxidoreductase subunit M